MAKSGLQDGVQQKFLLVALAAWCVPNIVLQQPRDGMLPRVNTTSFPLSCVNANPRCLALTPLVSRVQESLIQQPNQTDILLFVPSEVPSQRPESAVSVFFVFVRNEQSLTNSPLGWLLLVSHCVVACFSKAPLVLTAGMGGGWWGLLGDGLRLSTVWKPLDPPVVNELWNNGLRSDQIGHSFTPTY